MAMQEQAQQPRGRASFSRPDPEVLPAVNEVDESADETMAEAPTSPGSASPNQAPQSTRNGLPTEEPTLADLLQAQQEDQPAILLADEDSLDCVRAAYERGITDPEQLLALAEHAQPNQVRDARFSIKATFSGNLQALSRPKIIANLHLIMDNPAVQEVLAKKAVVHVHKLQRSQLMFQVDSKQAKKQLEGQKCSFLGGHLVFERCDPLSDDYYVDVMGIQSQSTARKVFHALVKLGCKPIYYNATYISQKTQVPSGILRYFLAGPTCPKALIVGGTVCTQFDVEGVLYAVKGKDLPPQYYHLQPSKRSPSCLELSGVLYGRQRMTKVGKNPIKMNKQSGEKRAREKEISQPDQQTESHEEVVTTVEEMDLSFDSPVELVHSAPPSPTQFPGTDFAHPPKRLQSRRIAPPPTPSSETWNSKNFWSHLQDVHPEVECRVTEEHDETVGFQILVSSIAPSERVVTSGEYAYYHKKDKSKAKLSPEATMLREKIPEMQKDILESNGNFELEKEALPAALAAKESKLLTTSPSSDAILKEIMKNRLAFTIKLSKLMRQKSAMIDEMAWTHLWYRCVHASVPSAKYTFATKWRKMTGAEAPTSRESMLASMEALKGEINAPSLDVSLAGRHLIIEYGFPVTGQDKFRTSKREVL